MDIARIDYWATSGRSVIHKSAPVSKAAATAMVIASVIVTHDLGLLVCLYLAVLMTAWFSKVPVRYVIALSFAPAFFTLLYAFSQVSGGWTLPALVIMKALTAGTSMIVLISTTPYADVIGLIGRFLPAVIRDGLFMTYRSFFILLGLMDRFMTALRLRGGLGGQRLVRNAGNIASGVGMLFIRSYDKSQMLYDVMTIRGYSGRLSAEKGLGRPGINDLPYFAVTAAFLLAAIFMKGPLSGGRIAVPVIIIAVYFAMMEALRFWKRSSE